MEKQEENVQLPPLRILRTFPETISDGEGIRFSIYLSGCAHNCPGCHNPESHDPAYGTIIDESIVCEITSRINSNPILDGVTFSGGDPFYNPYRFRELAKRIKEDTGHNIWCYTGYTYERIVSDPASYPVLEYIDVLVDGPFIKSLYDPRLAFRGSSNQRILRLSPSGDTAEDISCVF